MAFQKIEIGESGVHVKKTKQQTLVWNSFFVVFNANLIYYKCDAMLWGKQGRFYDLLGNSVFTKSLPSFPVHPSINLLKLYSRLLSPPQNVLWIETIFQIQIIIVQSVTRGQVSTEFVYKVSLPRFQSESYFVGNTQLQNFFFCLIICFEFNCCWFF